MSLPTWQWSLSAWRVRDQRSQFVLLLALVVAVSNPLACLVHCWVHTHPLPLVSAPAQVAKHAHYASHSAANSAPVQAPRPVTQQRSSDETLCREGHLAPSPLTIAVLMVVMLVTFWFVPTFTLQAQPLFLRLSDHPPPRRPPRF